MALRREVGTRTRVGCRGCDMSDLRAVMQNVWMFALIVIGVLLRQASGDICNDYEDVPSDWRTVSNTAETNRCDQQEYGAGKWYAFKVKDRHSNITTECIKNNKCGAEIPMRLDLKGSLPEEGKVIEASLCGSYNILGKYDCCVLRTPVRVSVCSGITVYQFPINPIDRCPVSICIEDPDEPTPPRSVIARTGDVHENSGSNEKTTTIGLHSSTVDGNTASTSATTPADFTSEPRSSDTSDAMVPIATSSDAHQGTISLSSDETTSDIRASPASHGPTDTTDVPGDAPISDPPGGDSTSDIRASPASHGPTDTTDVPRDAPISDPPGGDSTSDIRASPASQGLTDTTDVPRDAPISDTPGGDSTSDPSEKTLVTEAQSTVTTDTTPDPNFGPNETNNNNGPPLDFQQITTEQPLDSTAEFRIKTTAKELVQSLDSNVTTILPPPDATDETSISPKEVISEAITTLADHSTSRDGDGSGELYENTSNADDTILVPTSMTSTTDTSGDNINESKIPVSLASQAPESTDETTSTISPPGDDSETSATEGETTEPQNDDSIHSSPLTSHHSTSGTTSAEASTADDDAGATPTSTAALLPSRTPTAPLLLTTTVRPLATDFNDLILIETIRFVFKGNHSSIYFSGEVYKYLESFLTRAVRRDEFDPASRWNYTRIIPNPNSLRSNNVTTYVDVTIEHTAKDGIISVFDKLNLEGYLNQHGNLSLITKCRASASCEIEQPAQASTQSVFERNSPIFLTLIIICSVCLVVLVCIAVYVKCFRRGVYVAQEAEATNLADRRPYFNVNPSPFTDQQIMKDEVAMEKGEKPDKVDNASSCNGSDLIGGDSNTWVIPLDDAPVTSPVLSNEDTKL